MQPNCNQNDDQADVEEGQDDEYELVQNETETNNHHVVGEVLPGEQLVQNSVPMQPVANATRMTVEPGGAHSSRLVNFRRNNDLAGARLNNQVGFWLPTVTRYRFPITYSNPNLVFRQ